MQLSDGRGDLPTTPRDSSGLTAALAVERITRVLRAVNAVRRLDFHFLRAPTDWVADISALLAPLYGSLEEFKLTVSAISTEQAGAIAAVLADPDARLHRIEGRTTLPLEAPAVAVIAGALRSNLALSELLLTHVAAEDEEAVLGVIGEAYLANAARADAAAAAGGAAAARSDVLHHDAPFIPSRELRVVVGGRHKLFTLPAWGARAV